MLEKLFKDRIDKNLQKQALENTIHLNQVFIIRIPGRTVINIEQPNTMCVFGIDKSEQEFTLSDMLKANDIKWYRAEKVKDMLRGEDKNLIYCADGCGLRLVEVKY